MKVSKWGDTLAVRIPLDVVEALGLQEGDEVNLHRIPRTPALIPEDEAAVLLGIRKLARPLPPGYRFDREDANAR